ncbi:MAG: LIC_10190 family membrane protein, partial [Candidatus Acidiferrum sp.]
MLLLAETFFLVVCAAIAAAGYGYGLSVLLGIETNLGDRGILGLLSLGVFASLLQFVVALTPAVHYSILAVGALLALISAMKIPSSKIAWAGAVIVFLFALSHQQSAYSYDTGLYHLQTMRWITEHGIVPGLGNLHGRLAFNSMLFLVDGAIDRRGVGWIPNFLMMFFALLSLMIRLWNVTARGGRYALEWWILVLSILALAVNHYISGWYGVLNADAFIGILIVYWTAVALGLSASPNLAADFAMVVLTAIFAIVIKLSAVPLLLPALVLAWIVRKRLKAGSNVRLAATAGLVIVVWMMRGVVLSGCALYPVSQTCISSLPWAESENQVKEESLAIRSWARQPGDNDFARVLKDQAWLPRWFEAALGNHSMRLFVIFAPLGLIAALLKKPFQGEQAHCLLVVSGGLMACLIFWFVTAPNVRFGEGFFLAAALVGGSVACAAFFDRPRFAPYVPRIALACMALLSIRGLWR